MQLPAFSMLYITRRGKHPSWCPFRKHDGGKVLSWSPLIACST